METLEGLLTPYELAKRTPIKVNTWRLWLRTGKVPRVVFGRRVYVREQDIRDFIVREATAGEAKGSDDVKDALVNALLGPSATPLENGGTRPTRPRRRKSS